MAAIANAISRTRLSATETGFPTRLVLFCATGLLVSLLLLTFGVDLSPGLF